MAKDILKEKTISIMQMMFITIFLMGLSTPAISFVSLRLLAENQIITTEEKNKLTEHLEEQPQKALDEQKIYLLQESFNNKIMESLKNQIKELDQLKTDFIIHKTDSKIHL